MRNIGLIIGREFRERVYKKSFIITTLLMPIFFIVIRELRNETAILD